MSIPIQIILSDALYTRNPEQTELGRKIIISSIKLIDELGFEKYNFKRLSIEISSTEPSIYRYFANKHRVLVYLVAWYWSWLEFLIDYQTNNIEDPRKRLQNALRVLANASNYDPTFSHIDENALHRIVVAESSKAFLTKEVDGENEKGLFQGYKSLVNKLADIISEISPDMKYPHSLALTVIEASRKQIFFAQHLPSVTEVSVVGNDTSQVADYLEFLLFTILD